MKKVYYFYLMVSHSNQTTELYWAFKRSLVGYSVMEKNALLHDILIYSDAPVDV